MRLPWSVLAPLPVEGARAEPPGTPSLPKLAQGGLEMPAETRAVAERRSGNPVAQFHSQKGEAVAVRTEAVHGGDIVVAIAGYRLGQTDIRQVTESVAAGESLARHRYH